MSGAKSSGLAYLFALIGGVFGLHHLYLGRTKHALLWLTTFGGFGLGILDEIFFRLKNYIDEENNEHFYVKEYKRKMQECKSPAFEFKRFIGQSIIGAFYGLVTYYAFPSSWHHDSILSVLVACCTAFTIAIGVYLTGTLGPRQCSFVWPLVGALLGSPFLMVSINGAPSFNTVAWISSWIFEWKIDWDTEYFPQKSELSQEKKKSRQRRHIVKRSLIVAVGGILFLSILTSAICQNLEVDINGQKVKIKDVLGEFIRTRQYVHIYQRLTKVVKELFAFYRLYGFDGSWAHVWKSLDMQNVEQAYEILELEAGATQEDVEHQCRILPRKWHPDRFRNPEEKREAEAKFIEIQQACSRLSKDRQRRQAINSKKRQDPI